MKNKKNLPLRHCIVLNKEFEKDTLLRLTKKDGEIVIDIDQNMKGRGVYIYPSTNVILEAKKKKILNRAFKCVVDEEVYILLLCHTNE